MKKSQIKELDTSVIEQIAAGEVVERPANIVKELLENAIDANATKIEIDILKGGHDQIRIKDNGQGMSKEDLPLAIKRHATSKLSTIDDLLNISSLGFRGEALASICAVSKVTIRSKQEDSVSGTELCIHGGNIVSQKPCAHDVGTTIIVEDIFFNVPARKKFLRKPQTEFSHIAEIVSQYSILNPKLYFVLKHNNAVALTSPSVSRLSDKIGQIYGLTVAKSLLEVDYMDEESNIRIQGFISGPTQTRRDKEGISIFVNGRYVKNTELLKPIILGYSTLLMIGTYPYAVLHIYVDPQILDVNVHPRKDIVKFSDEALVQEHLTKSVFITLEEKEFIAKPQTKESTSSLTEYADAQSPYEKKRDESETHTQVYTESASDITAQKSIQQEESTQQAYDNQSESPHIAEEQKVFEPTSHIISTQMESFPELTYIGVLLKTYIICQSKTDVVLIDFHAAHERYLYEKFKDAYEAKGVQTQTLLEPFIFDSTPSLVAKVQVHQSFLETLGIEAEEFGHNTIRVRKIPLIGKKQLSKDTIHTIIEELPATQTTHSDTYHTLKERIFSTMGCRAAYKAGDDITSELAKKIVKWLLTSKQRFACPHGRPIFVQLTAYELEKMFKRKV
ncbi:MAG: DNA mismatch repair endonuclease MutL [Candidatus Woesearchaeota archaeon]